MENKQSFIDGGIGFGFGQAITQVEGEVTLDVDKLIAEKADRIENLGDKDIDELLDKVLELDTKVSNLRKKIQHKGDELVSLMVELAGMTGKHIILCEAIKADGKK